MRRDMFVHFSSVFNVSWIFWLVVWNMTFMTSHNIWECHHPNWRSPSFFRGVGLKTANQIFHDFPMIFRFFLVFIWVGIPPTRLDIITMIYLVVISWYFMIFLCFSHVFPIFSGSTHFLIQRISPRGGTPVTPTRLRACCGGRQASHVGHSNS